jgi:hypothetical protein
MYFVSLKQLVVGTHKIYIRARLGYENSHSENAKIYPIKIRVWSDLASHLWSECSILVKFTGTVRFTFVAKD